MNKVCVVTGTRADYGLLYWLMRELETSPCFQLQIIVTGMHLSPEFGSTWEIIRNDGFPISAKIPISLAHDKPADIARATGEATIGFADVLDDLSPDLMILLGDRYEALAAAAAASIHCVPIAHFHGGETTEGAFDEAFRHAITKMSYLHFTSAEVHRRRVIQLGEHPERVFNVGAMGLDNVRKLDLLDRDTFEKSIGFPLRDQNILVTFHPVTLEKNATAQFAALLAALDTHPELGIIFTKPNSDTGNRSISEQIDDYVAAHPDRAVAHTNLGQLRYLSALGHVDAVVGNSSSGLIEAPSFDIGTVNIGDRQKGRLAGPTVLHCACNPETIRQTINEALSRNFKGMKNPYGTAGAAERSIAILESQPLDGTVKKSFFDLPDESLHL
ncbi:MAG: UDP-N-acetylglucosamine 2-epimerase [Akkermansiaceae bacterium]|nr:UDP-N-acetylglucosamine 2-epimerase [Akkermansiaceae bacterium]